MGDRVNVIFKLPARKGYDEPDFYSPGVYVHDLGGVEGLKELFDLASRMAGCRKGDPTYAIFGFAQACAAERVARLKRRQAKGSDLDELRGYAHTGYGIVETPTVEDALAGFKEYSPGDCGVVVVDVNTGEATGFAGSLRGKKLPSIEMN